MTTFEQPPSPPANPAQQEPLGAVAALAMMYANRTPAPFVAEILFAAGDFSGDFTPTDICSPQKTELAASYVVPSLDALTDAGLLVRTAKGKSRSPGRYHKTAQLPLIHTEYNNLYTDLLSDYSGLRRTTIHRHAANMLTAAFFDPEDYADAVKNIVPAASQIAQISTEHTEHRMLTGYGRFIGLDSIVSRSIQRLTVNHPLASREKRVRPRRTRTR